MPMAFLHEYVVHCSLATTNPWPKPCLSSIWNCPWLPYLYLNSKSASYQPDSYRSARAVCHICYIELSPAYAMVALDTAYQGLYRLRLDRIFSLYQQTLHCIVNLPGAVLSTTFLYPSLSLVWHFYLISTTTREVAAPASAAASDRHSALGGSNCFWGSPYNKLCSAPCTQYPEIAKSCTRHLTKRSQWLAKLP